MNTSLSECGLVLLGHGSTTDPRTAEPIFDCADRLRDRFRDVRVALWKEQPAASEVLRTVDAAAVIVVPFFMADGWFTQEALPRELGLDRFPAIRVQTLGDQRVAYTEPIGTSALMDAAVQRVAMTVVDDAPRDFALVIVAHGTPKNPESTLSARRCAERIGAANVFAEVVALFVDDEPGLDTLADAVWSTDVVVVPFFVGLGPHVTKDAPAQMNLPPVWEFGGRYDVGDKRLRYLWPVGVSGTMDEAVLARAEEALVRLGPPGARSLSAAAAAASRFAAMVAEGERRIGNVMVSAREGGFVIGAAADAVRPSKRERRSVHGMHHWVRQNDVGKFRNWLSARDMASGWEVFCANESELRLALDLLAPAGLIAWADQQAGALRTRTWGETAAAQIGSARPARGIELEELPGLIADICHDCARTVAWRPDVGIHIRAGGLANGPPCAAPCRRILDEGAKRVMRR